MSKVLIVAHPETGELFTPTSKEGWVKCQVRSEELVVNNGVITMQARVAFPLVSANVAEAFGNLKSNDAFPVSGKIVRRTSTIPQYEDQNQVINPITGDDMGYYQSYVFTSDLGDTDRDITAELETQGVLQEEEEMING